MILLTYMLAVLLTVSAHVYPKLVLQLGFAIQLAGGLSDFNHPRIQTDIMPLPVKGMTLKMLTVVEMPSLFSQH